jgi:phosphoserine phosphatase
LVIKLIALDLDGVIVKEKSIWEKLHEIFGTIEASKKNRDKFFSGQITYKEWAELDTSLWQGQNFDTFLKIVDKFEYTDGAKEFFSYLKKQGIKSAIITSGLFRLANRVARDFGVNYVFANKIIESNGRIAGVKINCSFFSKGLVLKNILKKEGIKKINCLSVGDNINDIPMFKNAGIKVAFNSSCKELKDLADYVVDSANLVDIIPIIENATI